MDRPISRRALVAGVVLAPARLQATPVPAQGARDVPMYRGNAARTGDNPGPGPAGDPIVLWRLRLGKVLSSSPVVVDGVVCIGSIAYGTEQGGALHGVDADTGIERWRLATSPGDAILATPAIADGVVVTGSYDGIIVAADVQSGEERWRVQAEAVFLGSPAIDDGTVFLGDSGGHLYALDLATGRERWRVTFGNGTDHALGSPAILDGALCIVDGSRWAREPAVLRALDVATGKERWRFTPDDGSILRGTPIIAGGRVHVASRSPIAHVVDLTSGELQARLDFEVSLTTELALSGGALVAGGEGAVLQAVDARTGERRWGIRYDEGVEFVAPPVVADGVIYAGDRAGVIHAVDLLSGDERWSGIVESLRSSPAVIGGRLYIGGNDGALRAIGGTGIATPVDTSG